MLELEQKGETIQSSLVNFLNDNWVRERSSPCSLDICCPAFFRLTIMKSIYKSKGRKEIIVMTV